MSNVIRLRRPPPEKQAPAQAANLETGAHTITKEEPYSTLAQHRLQTCAGCGIAFQPRAPTHTLCYRCWSWTYGASLSRRAARAFRRAL